MYLDGFGKFLKKTFFKTNLAPPPQKHLLAISKKTHQYLAKNLTI